MFLAALFTTAKRQKQPKCPENDEQKWYTHTMEHYLALKKGRKSCHVFQHGHDMMLGEISQPQNSTYSMIPLIGGTWNHQFIARAGRGLPATRGGGDGELVFSGCRVSGGEDERVLDGWW